MGQKLPDLGTLPGRIVCIDDDKEIRGLVRDSFNMIEASPRPILANCGSGKEFLLRLNELQPSLILLDLNMPDMDGLDIIAAVRRNSETKDVPIIFLTGETRVVMDDSYDSLGVIGVIHKPFLPSELPSKIYDICLEAGVEGQDGEVLKEYMTEDTSDTFRASI